MEEMCFRENRSYQGMKSTGRSLDGKICWEFRDPDFQKVTDPGIKSSSDQWGECPRDPVP